MRADLFVLKSVAASVPDSLIGSEHLFKIMSDKFAGFYGAVLNLARIPYQGVIAVTFVIFPLISESTFAADMETTRGYIRSTFRYCILLIASVAILLAFNGVPRKRWFVRPRPRVASSTRLRLGSRRS